MGTHDAILVALTIVLIAAIVCQTPRAKFDSQPYFVDSVANPYTVLNKRLDMRRGQRHDGYNQTPHWEDPKRFSRYHRSGAHIKPEDIAEAERHQWFATSRRSGSYNTEVAHDPAADSTQYHSPEPAIDYQSAITDLVVDPRTRENHRRWVEEMKPWAGTAAKVDDLDMENYLNFQGLRRPQAVVQYNPQQLTEIDTHDLAKNKKFNFQG